MSYLSGPRLHFAGRFKADVSTVNNDVDNFNTNQPDGEWNPGGSGTWQLIGCKVSGAVSANGSFARTAADDPIVGLAMTDAAPQRAKIVDLDPQQQMVSQIWGLQLSLVNAGGDPAFAGKFEVAAFSDLWNRTPGGGGGDFALAAFWQSVITNVVWGNLGGSAILQQLQQASAGSGLSIKFNVDGFDMNANSSTFTTGRIVGAIGAAAPGEPHHFTIGRHCMPTGPRVYFFPAVVDTQRRKLIADLGNALSTTLTGGPVNPSLGLELGMLPKGSTFASLGTVTVGGDGWYEQTAGIVEVPPDRPLSTDEMTKLRTTPIALAGQSPTGSLSMLAKEGVDGLHVRPDRFFFRLSPGGTATVSVYATQFGEPLPSAQVAVSYDASGLKPGSTPDTAVALPTQALTFPGTLTTDQNGVAALTLTAHDLAKPRVFIDGQVYGVRCRLQQAAHGAGAYSNPWNFISALVWSSFAPSNGLTWWDDIQPILHQYANLYPFMKGLLDLGNYDDVVGNIPVLQEVFGLPDEHPHYMPVTRDLSPAKRQAILNWLVTTGNAGKPNLGTPPAMAALAAAPLAAALVPHPSLGAKTAALAARAPEAATLTRV
jgi:hypothetical protein